MTKEHIEKTYNELVTYCKEEFEKITGHAVIFVGNSRFGIDQNNIAKKFSMSLKDMIYFLTHSDYLDYNDLRRWVTSPYENLEFWDKSANEHKRD